LVGRQVAVSAVLTCDTCRHCVRGREEACADFQLLGVHRRGSYAEYCVVPAANLTPLPRGVSLPEGATLAANGGVAAAQLAAGQVEPGANVLVVGAAGSLGSTVAALAAFRGARVIGLDRLGDDPDRLSGLPLAAAVDGGAVDLPARLRAAAGADGIDCIVDNLGIAALWEAYLPALAATGVVVMSGAISQDPVPLAFRSLYLHSQSVIGVRTGNRAHRDALWADVDAGFRPPPGFVHVTSWECSNEAHARIEAGAARGQIVLDVAMAPLRLGSA
jgi:D-arabinose 1-dehydrogenase-like Zn-dependent alcohol dehydrogenase